MGPSECGKRSNFRLRCSVSRYATIRLLGDVPHESLIARDGSRDVHASRLYRVRPLARLSHYEASLMSQRTDAPSSCVQTLRAACVEAALLAYEDAGIRGLCAEGRWEAALAAMRHLDPSGHVAQSDVPPAGFARVDVAVDGVALHPRQ